MSTTLHRPLIPAHFSLLVDPPDESGEEALHFVSELRTFTIKGHSFREFRERVVPLLDGTKTIEEIADATGDVFELDDLVDSLQMLAEHGIVVEGNGHPGEVLDGDAEQHPSGARRRMAPQINLIHELAPGSDTQGEIEHASVAIVGLSGAGAQVALALAAAGIGHVRCVDPLPVTEADVYLSPVLGVESIGGSRAGRVASLLNEAAPQIDVTTRDGELTDEDDLIDAIAGADAVVCCLDAAQTNLIYKLNRVCHERRVRWVSASLGGAEIVLGPGVDPGSSSCYMCYRMRAIACTGNPELALEVEQQLDRAKRDDSSKRENFVFGAGIAANVLGLEVVKMVTGLTDPSLTGKIVTVRLVDLQVEHHTVLRKPWCPVCSPSRPAP